METFNSKIKEEIGILYHLDPRNYAYMITVLPTIIEMKIDGFTPTNEITYSIDGYVEHIGTHERTNISYISAQKIAPIVI